MVIKSLAADLYRAQRKVYELQEQIEQASPAAQERLKRELKAATAECDQLRRLVEAKKAKPLYRTSFQNNRKI